MGLTLKHCLPKDLDLSQAVELPEQSHIRDLEAAIHELGKLTCGGGYCGLKSPGREGLLHVVSSTGLLQGYEELSELAVQHFLGYLRDDFARKVSRAASDDLLIVHEKVAQ